MSAALRLIWWCDEADRLVLDEEEKQPIQEPEKAGAEVPVDD